jgi:nitronate monooxygenase
VGEGQIAYRCSAEPVAAYVAKGGKVENTVGRKCLCNALLANIGYAQIRNNDQVEPALITVGDDLNTVVQFLAPGRQSYSAADVVEMLLNGSVAEREAIAEPAHAATV